MTNLIDFIKGFRKTKDVNYFDYPASVRKMLLVESVKRANELQLALVKDNERILRKNYK